LAVMSFIESPWAWFGMAVSITSQRQEFGSRLRVAQGG
jgi:hypothetical protein